MSNHPLIAQSESIDWQVSATFGRREIHQDPGWDREFAHSLRAEHSAADLANLFARFRDGESAFDARMRRILIQAMCKSVGHDLQAGQSLVLKHPETMEFGDCVFIGAQAMIQGRYGGRCKIGNHVWIGPQAYFDARDLVLEDYVGWGPGAKVLGSEHTGVPLCEPMICTDLLVKPVKVGFGADIGMNASLLPGIQVGAHAIVGAGAVVTRDVPDYAIVAGTPARLIRDRRHM